MFYQETANKVILNIKVIPKASENKIIGLEKDFLKIKIKAVPEKGRANKELISFLSKKLDISKSDIEIISGFKNKFKKIAIPRDGIDKVRHII